MSVCQYVSGLIEYLITAIESSLWLQMTKTTSRYG